MDFETWQLVVTLQLVVAHCIHNNTNNNNNNNNDNNINSNNNKHMRCKVIVILIGVQGAQHLLRVLLGVTKQRGATSSKWLCCDWHTS